MSHIDESTGERVYTINESVATPHDAYIKAIFDNILQIHSIVSSMQDYNDIRLPLMVDLLINKVMNIKRRDEIKARKKEKLSEIKNNGHSGKEENRLIIEANIDIIGDVIQYIDRYIGLEEKQEVFRSGPHIPRPKQAE